MRGQAVQNLLAQVESGFEYIQCIVGGMVVAPTGGGRIYNRQIIEKMGQEIPKKFGDSYFYFFCSYSSCSSTVMVARGRASIRWMPISSPDTTL